MEMKLYVTMDFKSEDFKTNNEIVKEILQYIDSKLAESNSVIIDLEIK
jgi:hypothetical protein